MLKTIIAAALVAAAGLAHAAEPIKIGLVAALSGPSAQSGEAITRGLAIIPAVLVVGASGQAGATKLLVLSQVILSLQLPFAVVPLVRFTANKGLMGPFASPVWLRILAWIIAAIIIGLNLTLLWGLATG